MKKQRSREHGNGFRRDLDTAGGAEPGNRVHLHRRSIERDGCIEKDREHQQEDRDSVVTSGGRRDLRSDQSV